MANETHTITITAKDGTSQTFKAIGREATAAGKAAEDAGKRGSRGMKDWGDASRQTGLALGALTGLAIKAANESEQVQRRLQQSIENTGESYDALTPQIEALNKTALEFAFDDEDAAAALANLTDATGSATTALSDMSLVMDIARARGIGLADAAKIVAAVEQERYGSLARLGIQIDDNATREEALGQIQAKYAGQAASYATTNAAAYDRFGNSVENTLESLGSHLVDLQGPLIALGAGSQLLGPLSTGIQKVGQSAKVAQIGTAALALATGPVGLVAAAVAGGAAIYALATQLDDGRLSADEAEDAVTSLTDSIAKLGQGGAGKEVLGVLAGIADEYANLGVQSAATDERLKETRAELERLEAQREAASSAGDFKAIKSLDVMIAGYEKMMAAQEGNILTAEQYNTVQSESIHLMTNLNSLNANVVTARYNELWQEWEQGKISADDLAEGITYLDQTSATYGLTLAEIASQQNVVTDSTVELTAAQVGLWRFLGEQRGKAQDDYWKQQADDIEAATAAATAFGQSQANRGANAQTPTDPFALTIPSIRAYAEEQNALGLAMREAEQVAVAEAQALLAVSQSMMAAATSGSALDAGIRTILSGTESMTGGIEKVETSLTGLFAANDTGMSTMGQLLNDNRITQEQYDAALRATTDTQYNANEAALDAATIQAKQAPILADLAYRQGLYLDAVSQLPAAEQLVAMAYQDSARSAQALEIQTQLAAAAAGELGESGKGATKELIRGIAEADPVMAALLEDMGLISIGAEGTVKINWPEEGQSEMDRLTDALNQLQGTYEVLVGFDINEDGITGWVPPEVPPLPVDADPTPADATINDRINAWGGLTSTSKHYADTSEGEASVAVRVALWGGLTHTSLHFADTSSADNAVANSVANADAQSATIAIDAYTGPYYANLPATGQVIGTNYVYVETISLARGIGPHLHGGMVEPAAHGRMPGSATTLVGETGPELVSLPYGSSVTPASATKARLGNRGGGGGDVYIETLVVQSNDARQLVDTMRGYAIMGARP